MRIAGRVSARRCLPARPSPLKIPPPCFGSFKPTLTAKTAGPIFKPPSRACPFPTSSPKSAADNASRKRHLTRPNPSSPTAASCSPKSPPNRAGSRAAFLIANLTSASGPKLGKAYASTPTGLAKPWPTGSPMPSRSAFSPGLLSIPKPSTAKFFPKTNLPPCAQLPSPASPEAWIPKLRSPWQKPEKSGRSIAITSSTAEPWPAAATSCRASPAALVAFAEAAAASFSPAQAFVLDTCCCDDGYFILEPGCICHAGLYKADLNRLAWELDSMACDAPKPSGPSAFL